MWEAPQPVSGLVESASDPAVPDSEMFFPPALAFPEPSLISLVRPRTGVLEDLGVCGGTIGVHPASLKPSPGGSWVTQSQHLSSFEA